MESGIPLLFVNTNEDQFTDAPTVVNTKMLNQFHTTESLEDRGHRFEQGLVRSAVFGHRL